MGSGRTEIPKSFDSLDFDALWRGRERTTEVESGLVVAALAEAAPSRVLELGCGDGRLTRVVRSCAVEYVGVDQRFEFLRDHKRRWPSARSHLVEANLYHLPFQDAAASAAVLVRVYNFLPDPVAALREIRRVLTVGGSLVVTCNVRPSFGSLVEDVRLGVRRPPGRQTRSYTFSRDDSLPALPSPFPASAPRRRQFGRTLIEAGFERRSTFGCGLEDFRGVRTVPARVFIAGGTTLGSAPIFPLEWAVARNGPSALAPVLRPMEESLVCPRCRRPYGRVDLSRDGETPCAACGFALRVEDGIIRARFVGELAP
jgi:SAM-dependent methyltransferase